MDKNKTQPVGSIFNDPEYGLLQVVESDDCEGCVFDSEDGLICCRRGLTEESDVAGPCTKHARVDEKYVKFIPFQIPTLPVGSTFNDSMYGTLEVVEGNTCKDCVFYYWEGEGFCTKSFKSGFCSPKHRTDGKSVIYKTIRQ